jgi:hydroxypyruvate isomerase
VTPYRQGFAWWSFTEGRTPDERLLERAAGIGLAGVDFLPASLWPAARAVGLELVIIDGHGSLEVGFNNPAHHADLAEQVRGNLDAAAAAGVRNLSVASGDRGDVSDADAIAICAEGLAPLAAEAEAAGIGLLLEPLNSKIDHPGHQCDRTAWAAAVVDEVGSPALRILYDAYHMQIMEGDLLRTVAEQLPRIGHIHTAGVPGRHELDERQEVNWVALAHLLCERGYAGFVTHEFLPTRDPEDGLRQAFDTFDVS